MNRAHDASTAERFVGIDVAKNKLDVSILPQRQRFTLDYSDDGLAMLVAQMIELRPTLIVIEATGGYERRVAGELITAALAVAVVNPSRVRALAKATGTLAKNDRLDSDNLAYYAQVVRPAARAAAPQIQADLQALVTRRRQLVEMIVMEGNRLEKLRDGQLRAQARASVIKIRATLQQEQRLIDKEIFQLLKSDDEWDGKLQVLSSVPGVGVTTAATLVAELPELGKLSRRRIASLAGLAPFDRDSGTFRGKRFISGGRKSVRVALHMAAFNAVKYNPAIKAQYHRLRQAGKSFRCTMVACARKLLIVLNSLASRNEHWKPHMG
jgi:transposase